ncbi:MAG: hypothetical protein Ct9H90mP11_08690 [Acidimicrobiales bacterium]|nr:MAG: hypothetical protein Ct9H90mP11_08690 [Acidimicrobiales bacterium]
MKISTRTHQDMDSAKNLVNSISGQPGMVYSCARRVTPPSGTRELAIEIGTNPKNAYWLPMGTKSLWKIQD